MKGIIVKEENELKIKIDTPQFGALIIPPDGESNELIKTDNVLDCVDGYVVQKTSQSPEGVNFNQWLFHIESFDTD